VYGALYVNEVIYAELSIRMDSETKLAEAIAGLKLELVRMPRQALFVAGKIFQRYRAPAGSDRGSTRFFHWSARSGREMAGSDSRCPPLPDLFSQRGVNHAQSVDLAVEGNCTRKRLSFSG